MSWLTNFVRPKMQALVRRADVPDNLWDKCRPCGQMIFHRELEAALRVCPHCGYHMRLPAARRLELLFDDGEYNRIELPKSELDPLKFRDRKRYTDRLREAQAKTGEQDAIIVAHGTHRRPAGGDRRLQFRFHGRLDGQRGGRGADRRGAAGGPAGGGADRDSRPRAARACRRASSP